jgi:hypothetical protein
VSFFTFLSLVIFVKEILLQVEIITLQLVLASCSIIGSSLLVIVTIVTQAISQYNLHPRVYLKSVKIPRSLGQKMDEEAKKVIEKIRDMKSSAEVIRKIRTGEIEITENDIIASQKENLLIPSNGDYSRLLKLGFPSMGMIQSASNGLRAIQGMRIEHVTLLRETGINSVYDLSIQDSDELYRKILERGRSHEKYSDWIPTKGMIIRWIRIAKQI